MHKEKVEIHTFNGVRVTALQQRLLDRVSRQMESLEVLADVLQTSPESVAQIVKRLMPKFNGRLIYRRNQGVYFDSKIK